MLPSLKIGGSFPTVRLSSPCDICRLRTDGYRGHTNFLDFEIRVHGEKVFEVKWGPRLLGTSTRVIESNAARLAGAHARHFVGTRRFSSSRSTRPRESDFKVRSLYPTAAADELGWRAVTSLDEMILDLWDGA